MLQFSFPTWSSWSRSTWCDPEKHNAWCFLPQLISSPLFFNMQELLRCLETRRAENPVIELVGDIFVRLADYFKMYNMYCSNQPYSLVKFQNITTKAFKALILVRVESPP